MNVIVIDGQGGKMGRIFIEKAKAAAPECIIYAIGTNAIATSAMLKAGADHCATGENPVIVACRDADVIVGPIGIVVADALYGEITPAMAVAVGQSRAKKILLPMNTCNNIVVGVSDHSMSRIIEEAVKLLLTCF